MKFLLALVFALPFSSFAAQYAACDLFEFKYDASNNLVGSQRVSNTWDKLAGKSEVVLEDSFNGASYAVKFSSKGYITGSLAIKSDRTNIYTTNSVDLNDSLKISLEEKDLKGTKTVYSLDCGLDS